MRSTGLDWVYAPCTRITHPLKHNDTNSSNTMKLCKAELYFLIAIMTPGRSAKRKGTRVWWPDVFLVFGGECVILEHTHTHN